MIINQMSNSRPYAYLQITFPSGSTLTVSNTTGITIYPISSTVTSTYSVYAIPIAGTWTASMTDGTNTKTKNVVFSTFGETKSIELNYGLVLYDSVDGWGVDAFTSIAKGYVSSASTAKIPYIENVDGIIVGNVFMYNQVAAGGIYVSTSSLDLSSYSTIKLTGGMYNQGETTTQYYTRLCIWSSLGTYWNDNILANISSTDPSALTTYSADISNISSGYIGFGIYANGNNPQYPIAFAMKRLELII